ncbi:MAG: acyl-CoA thioesterase II [Myxococcota bacterium]
MKPILRELVDLLALEPLEVNLFRGQSQDLGWGRVYGGQVLGQALSAASQTVPSERVVHSLHAYFLRPGDAQKPIVYEVDPIRDGRSFTTRRVKAIQGGKAIFNLAASFQIAEEGLSHQSEMPDVPGPDGLLNESQLAAQVADKIPAALKDRALAERPIEARLVVPYNILRPRPAPPQRAVWFRAAGPLPDDPALHRYLLAYASDSHFIGTAMMPHGVSWLSPNMQVASLDHAMWFHRPFRMDEWLLHVIESPSAAGARGLVRGLWYDQQGQLVASNAQEGLMRQWEDTP